MLILAHCQKAFDVFFKRLCDAEFYVTSLVSHSNYWIKELFVCVVLKKTSSKKFDWLVLVLWSKRKLTLWFIIKNALWFIKWAFRAVCIHIHDILYYTILIYRYSLFVNGVQCFNKQFNKSDKVLDVTLYNLAYARHLERFTHN